MSERQISITEFYRGRSVFITGGTGFIGKVLIEKLLRCCPDIEAIFLLMRPKRGQEVKARLRDMLNAKLFDWLRTHRSESFDKLTAVSGDVTLPELGLSENDRSVLSENVSVVFHSAATVKFDEPLKHAVAMNLSGTKKIIELCHQMNKLEALIHVSTAYCNCNNRTEIEERIYKSSSRPEKVIQAVELLDDHLLEPLTPQLLNDFPNTYTFTKALAENMLLEEEGQLPIAIVRPSIVTASWKEPVEGWVSNLNGPTGLLAGAGQGILRSLHCNRDYVADMIPVDTVINLMITVAWHTAIERRNNIVVYHCTSGARNPLHWGRLERLLHDAIIKYPFSEMLWYPGGSFKKNKILNLICMKAFHTVPAYCLDLLARVAGKRPIMVKLQDRLQKAVKCIEFFTTNEFKFVGDNMARLVGELRPEDKKVFDFDIGQLDWAQYIDTYIFGIRKFIMKQEPSTICQARTTMKKMYVMHRLTQAVIIGVVMRLTMFRSEAVMRTWHSIFLFMLQMIRSVTNIISQ